MIMEENLYKKNMGLKMNNYNLALNETVKYIQSIMPEKYSITIENGKKFDRIVMNRYESKSVWGFIEKSTGSILKAKTWKAPETKHARGNIYLLEDSKVNIHWTGPAYMDSVKPFLPLDKALNEDL
jgi:hypothetical protein